MSFSFCLASTTDGGSAGLLNLGRVREREWIKYLSSATADGVVLFSPSPEVEMVSSSLDEYWHHTLRCTRCHLIHMGGVTMPTIILQCIARTDTT